MSYGSGTGNSFQSDYSKCERYFFEKHRNHLRAKSSDEAASLLVGTALHAWLQHFYESEMRGDILSVCLDHATTAFYDALRGAGQEDNLNSTELDERAATALALLGRRSDEIWRRLNNGDERTIACELHLTLTLPPTFDYAGTSYKIRPELLSYTVQIDRLYDQATHEDWEGPVRVVEDHKSTSASSPATYIEQCLMNDQSTGYVHTTNLVIIHERDNAFWGSRPKPMLGYHEPIGAVRYGGWRVKGPVTSAAAFAEALTGIDEAKCQDWYKRLLLVRARMSTQWDQPRDLWHASRFAHGPCTQFYRQCEFWDICDAPGDETRTVAEGYVTAPEEDRAPA